MAEPVQLNDFPGIYTCCSCSESLVSSRNSQPFAH
jgi:hypothetical protein